MDEIICNDSKRRHDFVLLFDVTDGNPNGDPDANNLPRIDPETMHGLVTDVCLKRKVRNYVSATRGDDIHYRIYVESRGYLVDHKRRAYEAVGAKPGEDSKKAREWMCSNYYDVRSFGAVLVGKKVEGYNCGQVRGPLQLTFGRSIDPVMPLDLTITRVALENRTETPAPGEQEEARTGTMGRKALIPYGLYKSYGFYNPFLAKETGFANEDLRLFWEALQMMWDLDRSASRGLMTCRGLYVFSHATGPGSAPAHVLFDRIEVMRKPAVEASRSFTDYEVRVNDENLPRGVTLTRFVV